MISITEAAKQHLIEITSKEDKLVRLGVKGGGCSGFTYDWQLIDEKENDDEAISLDDQHNLFIDGLSILYLAGLEIDYVTDIFGRTLQIRNPNVKSSCGCGESFNVA